MKKVLLRFLGEDDPFYFLNGKIYTAVSRCEDNIHLRIIDETEEDYIYSVKNFVIVEGDIKDLPLDGPEHIVVQTPNGIPQEDFFVDKPIEIKYS